MIYKKHDIERIAGRLICDDFYTNPSLAFTNTSYGASGTVLGSLYGKDTKNHTETTILYTLVKEHWDSDEVNLKKEITVVAWQLKENGKVIREYSKTETSEIIKTLYILDDEYGDTVYTSDPDYAAQARKTHFDRYRLSDTAPINNKKLVTDPKRYAKFVEYIAKHEGQILKTGASIYEEICRGAHEVYDYNTHEYVKKKYVELNLHYVYRNKNYFCTKSHIDF